MRRSSALLLCVLTAAAQTPLRVTDLERMALEANPSVAQAEATVRAARGRSLQAGLYPNPVLGANGEHVAPVNRGGALGGFLEQRIVTGGKLALDRRAALEEEKAVTAEAELRRLRVRNRARTLFHQAMGDERLAEVRAELADLAKRTAEISRELANLGMADQPDLLASEIEVEKAGLAVVHARNALTRTWTQIGALVARPDLTPRPLEGDFDTLPDLDFDRAMAAIVAGHPELRAAGALRAKAEYGLRRAEVQKIPDLQLRGGLRENGEQVEGGLPGRPRRVGLEGIFDVGIELPVFNRNQGAVFAARADLDGARAESKRLELGLRAMLAEEFRHYADARATEARLREAMIPKAQKAHALLLRNFRAMAVQYPRVLDALRTIVELREQHVAAVAEGWRRAVAIEGLLAGE